MERIVAKKLSRDLADREILPENGGGGGGGGASEQENANGKIHLNLYMTCTKDSREKKKLAVAIDLEDAYNKVQFKLLMDLLVQYGVSLTLTRWVAGTLLETAMVMQFGNWSSAPHQLTLDLPQGSPLSPVLFNVYIEGLADLNQNGPSKILTLADDGFM